MPTKSQPRPKVKYAYGSFEIKKALRARYNASGSEMPRHDTPEYSHEALSPRIYPNSERCSADN